MQRMSIYGHRRFYLGRFLKKYFRLAMRPFPFTAVGARDEE